MDLFAGRRAWSHYVALGDSLTAGRGDFGQDGQPMGWASRLAGMLSTRTGVQCALTKLAVDGATVGNVLDRQLPQLGGLQPDLISVTIGMNDIRGREFSPADFTVAVEQLFCTLEATGATILTCTLPDIADVVGLPPEYVEIGRQRLRQAGDIIRAQADSRGAVCVDIWAMTEVAGSPELFTADRLHPNTSGHVLLATKFADLLVPA
jgi:lysophospholipase L1-like esterase